MFSPRRRRTPTCGWWCWWRTRPSRPRPALTHGTCPCSPHEGWCCKTGDRGSECRLSGSGCGWQSRPLWTFWPSVKRRTWKTTESNMRGKVTDQRRRNWEDADMKVGRRSAFHWWDYYQQWWEITKYIHSTTELWCIWGTWTDRVNLFLKTTSFYMKYSLSYICISYRINLIMFYESV